MRCSRRGRRYRAVGRERVSLGPVHLRLQLGYVNGRQIILIEEVIGMQATAKSLGIDQLSLAERILLVEEIWDSIVAEADALEIPQSHKDELDRRLAAYQANPDAGATWEEVKARLQKKPGVAA